MPTRIYTYILRYDGGFAPNPFHGWCTLACCKPKIRAMAKRGDWIVGITPRDRGRGHRVAYAMRVAKTLSVNEYWRSPTFRTKRPRGKSGIPIVERCGDNCYRPVAHGKFRQVRRSGHWDHKNDREDSGTMEHDLGGVQVLVARRFCYYGANAVRLPTRFAFARPARGHRVFIANEHPALLRFLQRLPQGVHGKPRRWPKDDDSWLRQRARCV